MMELPFGWSGGGDDDDALTDAESGSEGLSAADFGAGEGDGEQLELEVDLRLEDLEHPGDGLVSRRTALSETYKHGSVECVEFEGVAACDGGVLVAAMASAGNSHLTASVVAGYLADSLKLEMVAELRCTKVPVMAVVEKSQPMAPIRIVGSGEAKVCVLTAEVKVGDGEVLADISAAVRAFCERHGIESVFTVSGTPKDAFEKDLEGRKDREKKLAKLKADKEKAAAPEAAGEAAAAPDKEKSADETKAEETEATEEKKSKKPKKPKKKITKREKREKQEKKDLELMEHMMYLTTSADIKKSLDEQGHYPLESAILDGFPGHYIMSAGGSMSVTCLLAPCHAKLPDAMSAVTVVRALDVFIPAIKIDLEPLKQKAHALEKSISKLKDIILAQVQGGGGGAGGGDAPVGMYM